MTTKTSVKNTEIIKHLNINIPLGMKGFSISDSRDYLRQVEKRIKILLERPVYSVMIFCKLIENSFAFASEEKNDVRQIINQIDSIMNFSAQLFDGVNELVKNVLEHTENRRGILSLRIYKLKDLKDIKMPEFGKYIEETNWKEKENQEFIDLVLLDDNESGILSQTISNLRELKNEFENFSYEQKIIDHDIKKLTNKSITLKDFFSISKTPLLHQEIRMAASLGLLIFSDFIKTNKGIIYISTIDNGNVKASLISPSQNEDIDQSSGMAYWNLL